MFQALMVCGQSGQFFFSAEAYRLRTK